MTTQDFELPGRFKLDQQSKAIEGAEAAGRKFASSRIWTNTAGAESNLATFEILDEAPDPPLGKPVLKRKLRHGQVAEWSGPMIVEGKTEDPIFLVRAAAT